MAPIDTSFSHRRPTVPLAPWDLDAPWILEPPSRLTFARDEESRGARLRRALREHLSGPGDLCNIGRALGALRRLRHR